MGQPELRIACWNVLADCYCAPSNSYISEWSYRFQQIRTVISSVASDTDIFMLQEVDHIDECYAPLFTQLGFSFVYVQRPGKEDGCLLACANRSLKIIQSEEVFFDDLAAIFSTTSTHSSYQAKGYRHGSFLRHNVAVIAQVRCQRNTLDGDETTPPGDVIVAVPHLYWNPHFAEVKEGQVMYLMDRIASFRERVMTSSLCCSDMPVVIGGDFNSLPDSRVYSILNTPFHAHHIQSTLCQPSFIPSLSPSRYVPELSLLVDSHGHGRVKFLCDQSLSKFCRWLRVLGISCAMYEPPPSTVSSQHAPPVQQTQTQQKKQQQQQKYDYPHLFSVARTQRRVLLTTARKVIQRSACPEAFFVNTKNNQTLEDSLIALFRLYNIPLELAKFLTVCGKCGGDVVSCHCDEYRRYLAAKTERDMSNSAAETSTGMLNVIKDTGANLAESEGDGADDDVWVPEDRQIFMCVECLQPYWWSENETSSPARAMQLAHRLYQRVRSSLMSEEEVEEADREKDWKGKTHGNSSAPEDINPVEDNNNRDLSTLPEGESLSKTQLRSLFADRDAALPSFSRHMQAQVTEGIESLSVLTTDTTSTLVGEEITAVTFIAADATEVARTSIVETEVDAAGHENMLLELKSALGDKHGQEPPFTNWTDEFKGTLDYIMVSSSCAVKEAWVVTSIFPHSALPVEESEDVPVETFRGTDSRGTQFPFRYQHMTEGSFPNSNWPSDHVMIRTQVAIRGDVELQGP